MLIKITKYKNREDKIIMFLYRKYQDHVKCCVKCTLLEISLGFLPGKECSDFLKSRVLKTETAKPGEFETVNYTDLGSLIETGPEICYY